MEKKEYIKPEMTVYQIKAPTILQATSSIRMAGDSEYDNLDEFLDEDGVIDADGGISAD